jgi:hypothetical protein
MPNQADQEKQQAETISSEEVRQFLLSELEARKQNIVELSNEQLSEIAGGFLPTREQAARSLYNGTISLMCCGMGAVAGYTAGKVFSHGNEKSAILGAGIGIRTGLALAKKGHLPMSEEHRTPQQDLEAGTAHEQNYGTFTSTGARH